VPNAEAHVLDAGHFALDTKAGEISVMLREFLERHRSKREGEELMATTAARVLSVNVGAVRESQRSSCQEWHLEISCRRSGSPLEASTSTETSKRIEKRMGDPIR
jgi:hypothetical protein